MDGDGRYLFPTGRAGTARKEEWVRRVIRADRYSRQFLTTRPNRPAGTARKAGWASTEGLKVRSVWGGGGVALTS
jgi:hypothetical protein